MNDWRPVLAAAALAVGLIGAAFTLSRAWTQTHPRQETIDVTGLSQRDFTADLIVWKGSFTRKGATMNEAYAAIKNDNEGVKAYLASKGVPESEIVFSSVSIQKEYGTEYDKDGNSRQTFDGFSLTQGVTIQSARVDAIETVSREVTALIDQGVEFYSQDPEYYYTGLAALKVEMLAAAAKDATNRAENIASNANAHVGLLKNANMGTFQITAQNSSEDYSWGGSFNTSSKQKTASITVHLDFEIRP
jgi:hypothetical protein